ncbi:MAG: hypothetical protein IKV87_09515 [Methanobrevibacter sp.]|nr:hypothetical protein [Methanobrevibacter sp.]
MNSTIINRAYYSAYSYAYLWLEENHNFKPKQKWEFDEDGESYITEHAQVRKKFEELKLYKISNRLFRIHELRKKADYSLFKTLTDGEIIESLEIMNYIFENLKFQKK